MCGIIGYVGEYNAVPIIIEGLKKLEYRGYDSAGLAVYIDGGFEVVKRKGRLSVLENEIEKNPMFLNLMINCLISVCWKSTSCFHHRYLLLYYSFSDIMSQLIKD